MGLIVRLIRIIYGIAWNIFKGIAMAFFATFAIIYVFASFPVFPILIYADDYKTMTVLFWSLIPGTICWLLFLLVELYEMGRELKLKN